jgi:ATP-dependent Clp protease ATP-binding subunit ClpC
MGLFAKIFSKASDHSQDTDAIMALAATESAGLDHNYVGTEHALCALMQTSDAKLIRIYTLFGIRIESVRDSVAEFVGGSSHNATEALRPKTPRLKRVLQLAKQYRKSDPKITPPQSLLLGILQEGNGVAIRALSLLSVNLARLRQELEAAKQSTDPTLASRTSPAWQEPRLP